MNEKSHDLLLCHRCGRELQPGEGNFYVVRIEAFADPTPAPLNTSDIDAEDINQQIEELLEAMKEMSQQELLDQVHRRMTLHLCGHCYRAWIENPTGEGS